MEVLNSIFTSNQQMWSLFLCALLIGMSKTGMQAINMISIPLMAIAFGAKPSTGIILPMLCFADLLAVLYYRKEASWGHVIKLLPTAIAGFFLAIFVDSFIPQNQFKILIAICIILGFIVMFWTKNNNDLNNTLLKTWWYAPLFGVLGGFSTMIGNAAGSIMAVYLLGARLPKLVFIGTNAWFFLILNYLKLPLQGFVWNNIDKESLLISASGIPFIIFGAILGVIFVKIIPDSYYRIFIIISTILSTIFMLAT